jgi:hypothetical protein
VARVSAKGCRVGRGVGEVRGTKARGRKWRRRREGETACGRRPSLLSTNLARVGLCGP